MMNVKVATRAGFCFGVQRAVEAARRALHDRDGPVYSYGPLIHNDQVTDMLINEGLNIIEDIDEVTGPGTLVIRSHGVVPEIYRCAEEKGLTVVDTTCPFVRKAQRIAQDLIKQGVPVVIVGDPDHPEVQGIVGWAEGKAQVAANAGQAKQLAKHPVLGVIAQTTQCYENFNQVVQVLENGDSRVQVHNTICSATVERQQDALALAKRVEVILVLGSEKSANTTKLADICRTAGKPVYRIETAEEIDFAWLKGLHSVGITAGASTPGWIIEEVYCLMMDFEEQKEEKVEETCTEENCSECACTEASSKEKACGEEGCCNASASDVCDVADEAVKAESEEQLVEESDDLSNQNQDDMSQGMEDAVEVKNLNNGDIVTGTVVQVNHDEVLVDVGAKSEGVVSLRELSNFNVDNPQDVVKVGDEIRVYVIKSEDNEGRIILSKTRADAEEAWANLEDDLNAGRIISGVVREVVKGGLLVDVGVRAFLPASLVDRGYVEELNKYLETEINVKVIEINRSRRKVILSRKAVLDEEFFKQRKEMMDNLAENQLLDGIVRRLTNFGAFVDIGGIDGLLHISEMAWFRIAHPSEIVQVGDEVQVMVLRVDKDNEKVSLGLKQVQPNPWDDIEERYAKDSIIDAKVVRLAPFGAFVQLEPGVEGLVHISHLAERHVATPDEVVHEDEEIKVKVLSVDAKEKHIRLSIREVDRVKPSKMAPKEPQLPKQEVVSTSNDGGTATIGDLVGDILLESKDD